MCDQLFPRLTNTNVPAVGFGADTGKFLAPLQHTNIDQGFVLRAVKTSKQQNVTVLGAPTVTGEEVEPSMRNGFAHLHEKCKKSNWS